MAILATFVATCLLASHVAARVIPSVTSAPTTPNPAKNIFRRAMLSEGCGFECTDDMGASTCNIAKGDNCRRAIREASCSAPQIETVETPTNERWDAVYAGEAWENLTIWYANEVYAKETALPFTRWMSDKLHARDNMDCQALADNNNCATTYLCDDVDFPAGFLILNSFTTINNMLWNFYDSIYNAKSDIESGMAALSGTFAPMDQGGLPLDIILDIVLMGYVTTAAPIWNLITRRLDFFTNPRWNGRDGNGLVKDLVNGLVTSGITLAKDLTPAEAKLAAEGDLALQVGAIVEVWAKSASEYSNQIFSGEAEQVAKLGSMMQEGILTQTPFGATGPDGDVSADAIKQRVKKSMYADLIPRAWRLSNLPLGPFILNTKKGCDETPNWVEVTEGRSFCVDDVLYVLTSTPNPDDNCGYSGDIYSCLEDFKDLPGADKLTGSDWGGLTVEDVVVGSVKTWKMHDEKNLGKLRMSDPAVVEQFDALADPFAEHPDSTFIDQILAEDVRAAGVMDIPVCDAFEATRNWERDNSWPEWPCDEPE